MDILAYLLAKKGHNTAAIDLPSYLLGRGGSKRIEKTGTDISLSPTAVGKLDIIFRGNVFQPTYSGKNLFDKNDLNAVKAFINIDTRVLQQNNNTKTLYISCLPNTTYTISRIAGKRFIVGDSIIRPQEGVNISVYNVVADNTATSITTTTSANAEYLCVFYYHATQDTLTEQEILDSIQIELGSQVSPYEPYTGGQPSPSSTYPQNIQVVTGNNTVTVSNGDNQSQSYPLNLGSLELAKIGNYGDSIEGTPDNWVKTKVIEKIDSYNGETITTDYISTTGGLDTGATVYYVLQTPVSVPITDSTLIGQLNNIYNNASSYDGTTNITSTHETGNTPMIFTASALRG